MNAAPMGRQSIARGASPWFTNAIWNASPNGATVRWPSYCRPDGAYESQMPLYQGLTPLAINCRRVAAGMLAIIRPARQGGTP
jgi:hypothetical protein